MARWNLAIRLTVNREPTLLFKNSCCRLLMSSTGQTWSELLRYTAAAAVGCALGYTACRIWRTDLKTAKNLDECIGETPMVEVDVGRLGFPECGAKILAKLEMQNPGDSSCVPNFSPTIP